MRISNDEHTRHAWRVDAIAADYELEDVWQFPLVITQPQDGLARFHQAFENGMARLMGDGLPGMLFRLRLWLGKLMRWDQVPDPTTPTYELGKRWQASGGVLAARKPQETAGFQEVYRFENESLAEISNSTIDAALHLGQIPQADGTARIQMAVYVRKKGFLSACYMALIKPFRLWIVYPKMMKTMAAEWHKIQQP